MDGSSRTGFNVVMTAVVALGLPCGAGDASADSPGSQPAVRFADASVAVFADPKDRNFRLATVIESDAEGRCTLLAAGDVEGRAGEFTTRLAEFRMGADGRFEVFPLTLTPKVSRFWFAEAGDEVLLGGDLGVCLLRRGGTGGFDDVTEAAGLRWLPARRAKWVEADGDGACELWVATPRGARLFRRASGGGCDDITESVGIGRTGETYDVLSIDLDGDGATDLFASRGHAPVAVFKGAAGGRFEALSATTAAWPESAWMIATDFENDGKPNVLLVHLDHFMHFNGKFSDPVRVELGGFGPPVVTPIDYDNDGWTDLLVSGLTSREQNPLGLRLLRNERGASWSDVSASVGFSADTLPDGRVQAVLDADGDGDSDILAFDGARLVYLRNDGGERNGQIKLRLRASDRLGAALGAKVELVDGEYSVCRFVDGPQTEIGLAGRKKIATLRVTWPDGKQEERRAVLAGPGAILMDRGK